MQRAVDSLSVNGKTVFFINPAKADVSGDAFHSLPFSLRVLLENVLRAAAQGVGKDSVEKNGAAAWLLNAEKSGPAPEFDFYPARVLIHDFTGIPALADLTAMREAMAEAGGDPELINPMIPVALTIDHSVLVDHFGSSASVRENSELEYRRNSERFSLLKWAGASMRNLVVSPPCKGICHHLHLEYFSPGVMQSDTDGRLWAYPDTLVGADSHTGTLSGMGVLSFGVGGIEVESMMLGEPYTMRVPDVVGVHLTGKLPEGVTATDLALTLTALLRKEGVVEKFVEYTGPGVAALSVPARCTVANMAPEYGATIGFFPMDEEVLHYLENTGRKEAAALAGAVARKGGFFSTGKETLSFTRRIDFDLGSVEPCIAGPSRPQQHIPLRQSGAAVTRLLEAETPGQAVLDMPGGERITVGHGAVALAALTSCTNTINPRLMMGAALTAKNAVLRGLSVPPYVKTVLAPGSATVTRYLADAGLLPYLEALGFHPVGYSCLTCIGNSGPLTPVMTKAVTENGLNVAAVLSANRNFEARVNPLVRSNFLASPPLVVAFALAGSMTVDMEKDPLGFDREGRPVFLRDILPSDKDIDVMVETYVTPDIFAEEYGELLKGDPLWDKLTVPQGKTFIWDDASTYIKKPPYFDGFTKEPVPPPPVQDARVLLFFGDGVTTDHISPSGVIPEHYPAGRYLLSRGVAVKDFNIYGTRRGNHEVMARGTFANIRLKNRLAAPKEGSYTRKFPENEEMFVFEAAERYRAEGTPLVILAGAEYGTGSSRDWAAKGPRLLGVRAVMARSFERIHRNNLVGMGILPLEFMPGESADSLGLDGGETFTIAETQNPGILKKTVVRAQKADGRVIAFDVLMRLDTPVEVEYYLNGGILPYVLRKILHRKGR